MVSNFNSFSGRQRHQNLHIYIYTCLYSFIFIHITVLRNHVDSPFYGEKWIFISHKIYSKGVFSLNNLNKDLLSAKILYLYKVSIVKMVKRDSSDSVFLLNALRLNSGDTNILNVISWPFEIKTMNLECSQIALIWLLCLQVILAIYL